MISLVFDILRRFAAALAVSPGVGADPHMFMLWCVAMPLNNLRGVVFFLHMFRVFSRFRYDLGVPWLSCFKVGVLLLFGSVWYGFPCRSAQACVKAIQIPAGTAIIDK